VWVSVMFLPPYQNAQSIKKIPLTKSGRK